MQGAEVINHGNWNFEEEAGIREGVSEPKYNTGLFEMSVGVLTIRHTQHTWDRSM